MAFKVELTVDDQTFTVRDFYLSILRPTNDKGQPSSKPSWTLDVTIDAVSETTITQWMIDPSKQSDGSIAVYKTDGDGTLKKLSFSKSNCFGMVDRFIPGMSDASCYFRIAGEEIQVGTVTLSSNS